MRQGGDGRRPCGAFSEVTLRLPIDRAQCQSLADLGLQQVALIEAVHSILFIVDAVGDVFQVLQVRPGKTGNNNLAKKHFECYHTTLDYFLFIPFCLA